MHIRLSKLFITFIILALLFQKASATTWSAAYPYTQRIEGQDVVVKAFSYDPYNASPMLGSTRVYFKNKLLYSIDKYYRERIFTSDDGEYMAVVYTSNSAGLSSYTSFGNEKLDFSEPAIEVLKHGQPYRTFAMKEVIDTTKLNNNSQFFYWGYQLDYGFKSVEDNCEICREVYGRRILRKGDTTKIYPADLKECLGACDSLKLLKTELKLYTNSVYVSNNALYILTNQDMVVRLDFSDMSIQKIPLNEVIPNKENYYPPKLHRKYKKIKLPEKGVAEPRLKDGRRLAEAIAGLFELTVTENQDERYTIFIDYLVIDRKGKCVDFYGSIYDNQVSEWFIYEAIDQQMTEKLEAWITKQTFRTNLLPRRFEKYSFLCIVDLK